MSDRLQSLNDAINIVNAARMSCMDDSPYGWDKNYRVHKYLMKQIVARFTPEAA